VSGMRCRREARIQTCAGLSARARGRGEQTHPVLGVAWVDPSRERVGGFDQEKVAVCIPHTVDTSDLTVTVTLK
jgi:hypothetical protein